MLFGFGKPNVKDMEKKNDVKGLVEALGYEKDVQVRREAAYTLGKIGNSSAVEPLIKALNDPDSYVRRQAVDALGNIGDARAIEPLNKALNDSNSYVCQGAADALKKINDKSAML
jgi:HEAT repeat protein